MARRKKKTEAALDPVIEEPMVEPEVIDPEPEPNDDEPDGKEPQYFLAKGVSFCTRKGVKGPGEQVFPDSFPGGVETLEAMVAKGQVEKR